MSFKDKVVVVTGGAGALGQGVVHWFANQGARIAILDYSEALLTTSYPSPDAKHIYMACDLTNRASCAKAVSQILKAFGHIDVLANIAGGFLMGDPVHETSDQTWDFLFDINTRSILNMSASVVPSMLAKQEDDLAAGGKIINVAARAALSGAAGMGAYTASKAAVMRLTESMALELRDQQINVNAVMPSLIDTPKNRIDMPDADFSRWVTPKQLANVIGFLASDAASAVNGACIPVDGLS